MIVRSRCDVSKIYPDIYIGYHELFVSFQYLFSGDVSNTTTQCDSIWTQFSLLMEAVLSGPIEYASMIKLSEVQFKICT